MRSILIPAPHERMTGPYVLVRARRTCAPFEVALFLPGDQTTLSCDMFRLAADVRRDSRLSPFAPRKTTISSAFRAKPWAGLSTSLRGTGQKRNSKTRELGRHIPIEEKLHAARVLSNSTAAMTCLECTLNQSATSSASWSLASYDAARTAVVIPTPFAGRPGAFCIPAVSFAMRRRGL